MSEQEELISVSEQDTPIEWIDFLLEHPPGRIVHVRRAINVISGKAPLKSMSPRAFRIITPRLQLHCPEVSCNGPMFFDTDEILEFSGAGGSKNFFLPYVCRNCDKYMKTFAIFIRPLENNLCEVYKYGEYPPFGPPVPSRVISLIQPDRELFLSGRRCENQGLGIGAFSYYRRVVVNQWTRLVNDIIKMAKIDDSQNTEMIKSLEDCKDHSQFTRPVKEFKDAIPPALLIDGHNPLILLHSALSEGLHDLTDEECLTIATSIRVVLVELAEKLGQALKDKQEIKDAVSRLHKVKGKSSQEKEGGS